MIRLTDEQWYLIIRPSSQDMISFFELRLNAWSMKNGFSLTIINQNLKPR